MKSGGIEVNVGVACAILALSPLSDLFKKVTISSMFGINITAFHIYIIYASLFVLFVIFQLYQSAYLSITTNLIKRIRLIKYLKLTYFFLLTFPPFIIINIAISNLLYRHEMTDENTFFKTPRATVILVFFVVLISFFEYSKKFKNFENEFIAKERLKNDLKLSDYLLQRDELVGLALLHYRMSVNLLKLILNDTEYLNKEGGGSITDFSTKAFLSKKISEDQKSEFEKIGISWDWANCSNLSDLEKGAKENIEIQKILEIKIVKVSRDKEKKRECIYRNNLFLHSEIENYLE